VLADVTGNIRASRVTQLYRTRRRSASGDLSVPAKRGGDRHDVPHRQRVVISEVRARRARQTYGAGPRATTALTEQER
jgi:hypothetical protein